MKSIKYILLFIFSIFVLQCTTNNILQTDYEGDDALILGNESDISNFKFDRYRLNKISVKGDSAIINLSYSGGCRDHTFYLVAKDYFENSSASQVKLVLSHNSNFDPCERFVTEDHTFNLRPLKYEYVKSFGKQSGSIQLVLEEQAVTYRF